MVILPFLSVGKSKIYADLADAFIENYEQFVDVAIAHRDIVR
jgi:hypothetical protein